MGLQRVEHDLATEQQQFLNTEDLSQASSDFQFLFVEIKPTLMKYSRVVLDDLVVFQSLSRVQLFATLWTVAHQAPVSMGLSRQEYWSGLPCSLQGDLPDPGMEPASLKSGALAGGSLPLVPPWEDPEEP